MSFNEYETSNRGGKPVFLYRFVGGTQIYTYTTAAEPHTYLSEIYEPLEGLDASGTGQSQEVNAQRITVTATKNWLIPRQYVAFVPALQMFLTIFKFHRDDVNSVNTYWQGFVRSADFTDGGTAKVVCDPITVLFDRAGLRRTFSALCGHVLYDGFCSVPASAYRTDGILSQAPAGFTITAPQWATQPDGWFKAGYVERPLITGVIDMRFVINHIGDTLTLLSPFPDDVLDGETIRAYAGCDHLFSTCSSKFGAYTDNGGACGCFNRVPKKNLFKTGVINAG